MMLSKLMEFFGKKKPEIAQPEDQFQRILINLGALTHDVTTRYNARLAMTQVITVSSKTPAELSKWLSEASRVVDKALDVPEKWKGTVRIEKSAILDDYFTDRGYVVNLRQWLDLNKPKIERLISAFIAMDETDRHYYQRNYNSVLRDTDAILAALVKVSMQ